MLPDNNTELYFHILYAYPAQVQQRFEKILNFFIHVKHPFIRRNASVTWGGSEWQQKEDLEKALPGFSSSAAEKGDKTEGFDG